VKRIAKIVLLFVSVLAILGAGVIGITQTTAFRNWLRGYLAGVAAQNLNGTVTFGELHGNLLTGFRIDNVTFVMEGDTVFSCSDVLVRYNPVRIPSQFLSVAEFVVHNPTINLWKGAHDTTWNFERIVKPTGKPPGDFTWTIEAEDVELQNATVSVCDSSASQTERGQISLLRQTTHNVFASLGCVVSKNVQHVTINHLGLYEPVTGFTLKDMSGELYHAGDSIHVNFDRIQTLNSDVAVDIGADIPVDSAHAAFKDIANKIRLSATINAKKFAFREASLFDSVFAPFDSTVAVTFAGAGTANDFTIKRCQIKLDSSSLSFTGVLRHVLTPSDWGGEIKIPKSLIVSREALARMPGMHLQDYGYLGDIRIEGVELRGDAKNASLTANLSTNIGAVSVEGTMARKDSLFNIAAHTAFTNINLEPISPSTMPSSAIAGSAQITGMGSSVADFKGTAAVELTPTKISGRALDHISLHCSIDHKRASIDNLAGALASDNGSFTAHGLIDFHDVPRFQLTLATENFNLAGITLDSKVTKINCSITTAGKSFSPDSLILDSLQLAALPSVVYGRQFPGFTATLFMTKENDNTVTTTLSSEIGTAKITGTYSVYALIDKLNAAGNAVAAISTDSIMPAFGSAQPQRDSMLAAINIPWLFQDKKPINARFQFDVKNTALLSSFLETDIDSRAQLKGSLISDSAAVKTIIEGDFESFSLTRNSTNIHFGKTIIHTDIAQILSPRTQPNTFNRVQQNIGINIHTDLLDINDLGFTDPRVDFSYNRGRTAYSASTVMGDSDNIALSVSGNGEFSNVKAGDSSARCFEASFDSLRVAYGNNVHWNAASPITTAFTGGAINFHSAAMRSDSALLSWKGVYDAPDFHNLEFTLNRFALQSLRFYADSATLAGLKGVIRTMHVVVNGTTDNPVFAMDDLECDHVTYNQTDFGFLRAAFKYANKEGSGDAHITTQKGDTTNAIDTAHRVDITVAKFPLDLGLHAVPKRIPDGATIDATARLSSFSISFLELIQNLPVDQLRGYSTGDMIINGTTPNFRYNGSMKVFDAGFRSTSTNIFYTAKGDIKLGFDTLQIVHAHVENVPTDLPGDSAIVWGNLFFNGFNLRGFDLWMQTDKFLVLNEASRSVTSSVYGNLILSTMPKQSDFVDETPNKNEALHFYGNVNTPSLAGKLYIGESSLTFPETQQQSQTGGYDVIYDLSALNKRKTPVHVRGVNDSSYTVSQAAPLVQDILYSGGLVDRLQYYLHIETTGDLRIAMDFGPTEKLEDVLLSGNLDFTRDNQGATSLTGILNVKGGTYSFFDQFQIESGSSMQFIDSVQNPRLNITARTPPRIHYTESQATEYVQVEVIITGTRLVPHMELRLLRGPNSNSLVEQAQSSDNQSRAVLFLVTHQFPEDFSASTGTGNFGNTLVTTTASQMLNTLVRQLGISATVNVQNDQTNILSSRVNVSSQFGNYLISAGLHTAQPSNLDATVAFSLGDVLGVIWLEQTRIEAERSSTEIGSETSIVTTPQDAVYSLRIGTADLIGGIGKGIGQFFNLITGAGSKDTTKIKSDSLNSRNIQEPQPRDNHSQPPIPASTNNDAVLLNNKSDN